MPHLFELDDQTSSPGIFIGMDEAGYGPNLGPLVIASTRWNTPTSPDVCNFNALLNGISDPKSTCKHSKLHIADSKEVNKGKYGFQSLETSAISLLQAAGITTETFKSVWKQISPSTFPQSEVPWFEEDLNLPIEADETIVRHFAERLTQTLEANELSCQAIQAQIIPAHRFNELLGKFNSKGIVLSTLTFELLGRAWNSNDAIQTLVVGDKHGGRNKYDEFLSSITQAATIHQLEESRAQSRYRVHQTEFRFQMKGEQHFPVAAASLVAKYTRELSMILFNQFWKKHLPDLKPTKGYPVDAKRFLNDIEPTRQQIHIDKTLLWRSR